MVNTDSRYLETGIILNSITPGTPIKLYKTTRAGATTGLCANAVDNNQTFCLIAPTKKIAHETITTTEKYANRKGLKIKTLVANQECIIIQEKIKQYPDVGALPIIPLPGYCNTCGYHDECPITEFLRADRTTLDGIGLTYNKLTAIVYSESKLAKNILEKMIDVLDVVIFDEADYYEGNQSTSIQVYPELRIIDRLRSSIDNKTIKTYLDEYQRILTEASKLIEPLLSNKNDYAKRSMSFPLKDSFDIDATSKGMKAVVDIMVNRAKYNLSVKDVQYLSNIIMIMSEGELVVHYIKVDGTDTIQLSANSGLYIATKLFLKKLIDKKIVFTSATLGDYDYIPIFGQYDERVMKDTKNSNLKMIIYPDTYMLDSIRIKKGKRMDVLQKVEDYEIKYPGIQFICMKKNTSGWLKQSLKDRGCLPHTDYYRSDTSLGVTNNDRRCVLVGPATSPINAFDGVSKNYEESQKRRINNNHAALWQAISRFKDPAGEVTSHVHCIGITEAELKIALTWGKGRHIEMDGIRCKNVTTTESFSKVTILSKDEMKVLNLLRQPGATFNSVMAQSTKRLPISKIVKCYYNLKEMEII